MCFSFQRNNFRDALSDVINNIQRHAIMNAINSEPGGGTPIHYVYGYVPPKGVVILKLLI